MEQDKIILLKEFYTLEQLSHEIGIAIPSLRNFIKDGELVASKVGTRYVIKRDSIIKWLDDNQIKPKSKETQQD